MGAAASRPPTLGIRHLSSGVRRVSHIANGGSWRSRRRPAPGRELRHDQAINARISAKLTGKLDYNTLREPIRARIKRRMTLAKTGTSKTAAKKAPVKKPAAKKPAARKPAAKKAAPKKK